MIRFVKYLLSIILYVIVFAYLLNYIYTSAFHTNFARNKTQYTVQLQNVHIDYIFLGSSRTENHIDCALIEQLTGKSCLNLGLQGSRVNDSASLLQILIDNKVTYEKLFYQLDYSVNSNDFSPAFISSLLPFLNDNSVKSNVISKLDLPITFSIPFVKYAKNDRIIGLREVLLQFYGKPGRIDLSIGFEGRDGVGEDIKGDLPKTIKENNLGIQWMQSIESSNLMFFTAPYCATALNRDIMAQELKKKYPAVISYINLFDNQEGYFTDCGHLNEKGAQYFTRILTEDLLID